MCVCSCIVTYLTLLTDRAPTIPVIIILFVYILRGCTGSMWSAGQEKIITSTKLQRKHENKNKSKTNQKQNRKQETSNNSTYMNDQHRQGTYMTEITDRRPIDRAERVWYTASRELSDRRHDDGETTVLRNTVEPNNSRTTFS